MSEAIRWAFEDFEVGTSIVLPPYRVSEEEILAFARQYDPQPFHVDAEAAQHSIFGGLVASGWMTTAVFMRMQYDGFLRSSSCLGSPGVDEIRWLLPVRPGDELRGEARVTEVRPSRSKPDRGVVFTDCHLENQAGELVMTLKAKALFARRDTERA
ncbi:MaoC family dehydratase [Parahaliea mediterranea]|uniref:MaoC family dehydratase n=1 Tax=Parahaliea mediterranea TaxID=651086 RepID=UPI000E2FDC0F|nr:MaoC family dehydratase [Parahaliea mediterranea]